MRFLNAVLGVGRLGPGGTTVVDRYCTNGMAEAVREAFEVYALLAYSLLRVYKL